MDQFFGVRWHFSAKLHGVTSVMIVISILIAVIVADYLTSSIVAWYQAYRVVGGSVFWGTLVLLYQTTRRHASDDRNIDSDRKSQSSWLTHYLMSSSIVAGPCSSVGIATD